MVIYLTMQFEYRTWSTIEVIKDKLEELNPQVAADVIFGEYIKHEIPSTR